MFQELNERIARLQADVRTMRHAEQHLKELKQQRIEAERSRDQFALTLQKEQQDVERLNSLSLDALFFTILGRKQERLSKEEEEALQAKVRFDEATDTLQDLEQEILQWQRKLGDLVGAESDLSDLLEHKKQRIHAELPALAVQLSELTNKSSELQADQTELREAISAGNTVLSSLDQAQDRMSSAKNWGTWDMLGGGMLSTAMKHSRISEAREAMHTAQRNLRRFERELKDVERDISIDLHIGEFLTFADYFFDGFITDYLVQGKINDALDQIEHRRSKIKGIVNSLNTELARTVAEVKQIESNFASIIEGA